MNFNANTIEEAKHYMQIRNNQLKTLNIEVDEVINYEDKALITVYNNHHCSIYILLDYRGQGLFLSILQQFMLPIITSEDCGIKEYLDSIKTNYMLVPLPKIIDMIKDTQAYQLIKNHYRNTTTLRSGVKLINHIDEGLSYMIELGASQDAMEAYCLHPLLQSDEDLLLHIDDDFTGVSYKVIILVMEYRRVANSYLSTNKLEDFVGFTSTDIYHMLWADKKQNEKDFTVYHEGTHKRSKELREYFDNWFGLLNIL